MIKPQIKCLISGNETDNAVSVFEEIVAVDAGPPLHTHENQLEIFHVITGHIQFEIDGKRIDVHQGGAVVIPPGATHAFVNKSSGESVIHFELLPSGNVEPFFEKLVAGDFEDPAALFAAHGMKLAGPPIR